MFVKNLIILKGFPETISKQRINLLDNLEAWPWSFSYSETLHDWRSWQKVRYLKTFVKNGDVRISTVYLYT